MTAAAQPQPVPTPTAAPAEVWLLLRPLTGGEWSGTPAIRPRLAGALKLLLRKFGLECRGVWPRQVLTGEGPASA